MTRRLINHLFPKPTVFILVYCQFKFLLRSISLNLSNKAPKRDHGNMEPDGLTEFQTLRVVNSLHLAYTHRRKVE